AEERVAALAEEPAEEPAEEIGTMTESAIKTAPDNAPETGELVSDATASAAAASMARLLSQNVAVERDQPSRTGAVTLEEMALELMRPLIREWLDRNLAAIVEKKVEQEIA